MMPSPCGLTACFGMYPVIFHEKSFSIAHLYEPQLNKRIKSFLGVDGGDPYDTDRFLDIKLSCREQMLYPVIFHEKSFSIAHLPSSESDGNH